MQGFPAEHALVPARLLQDERVRPATCGFTQYAAPVVRRVVAPGAGTVGLRARGKVARAHVHFACSASLAGAADVVAHHASDAGRSLLAASQRDIFAELAQVAPVTRRAGIGPDIGGGRAQSMSSQRDGSARRTPPSRPSRWRSTARRSRWARRRAACWPRSSTHSPGLPLRLWHRLMGRWRRGSTTCTSWARSSTGAIPRPPTVSQADALAQKASSSRAHLLRRLVAQLAGAVCARAGGD